jgi:hypothetical protein
MLNKGLVGRMIDLKYVAIMVRLISLYVFYLVKMVPDRVPRMHDKIYGFDVVVWLNMWFRYFMFIVFCIAL